MRIKATDILAKKENQIISVKTGSSVLDAIRTMNRHRLGAVLVLDKKGIIAGIVSERDILHEVDKRDGSIKDLRVDEIMTSDIIIGLPDDEAGYLLGIMTRNRVRHLPIIDDKKKIIGIVSIGDLVKSKLDDIEFQNRLLSQYIQAG